MIEFDVEKIHIPLKQHVGGPCQAIVNVGDHVKRGQLVAVPAGLGANIHASLSGVVEEITEMDIVVKLDKEQTDDYVRLEKTDDYLQKIKDAGIVGVGGAGFPTGIKFSTQIPGGYLIANAAECEPILGHNVKFMEEQPEVLVRGMKYIMELTGAKEGYIAIKTKYRKALLALGKACKNEPNISIKILPNMYPAGDERVIVRETLGVILQPGQLPLEANAIISNVETIKHVVNAIEDDKPLIAIGLPISVFIERAGGYINPHGEIVRGGPFTGRPAQENEPINKTTGGLLVAMPYPQEREKVGILICECGAQEERLRQIADGMGAEVVSVQMCKRMKPDKNGRLRCELPGICPGQAEKVLKMKKDGAKAVIAGTCQD